ncbi:GIY-YIG nuclease family protein [Salmonirosea aquatica]
MKSLTKIKEGDSGIYKITCLVSGKIYVGSSVNLKSRLRIHRHKLIKGTHPNAHLASAFKRYGAESFVFEVVEFVANKYDLQSREQHWIDSTDCCNRAIGYNVAISAENRALSDETKRKMSAIAKKRPSSYYDYARELYKGRPIPLEQRAQISNSLKGRKITAEQEKNRVDGLCKNVYILQSPDGEIHQTINPSQFARDNGLMVAHIYGMRDGNRKSTKGWKLIDVKPRIQP